MTTNAPDCALSSLFEVQKELDRRSYKLIIMAVCGSRLYGTAGPDSDTDYVVVYMTSTTELLMNKYLKSFELKTNKTKSKNTSKDTDIKFVELGQFINDALGGQTYALDLLWTPENLHIASSPIWGFISYVRDKLVTNNMYPFIRYCQGQAHKYSDKGTKYKELEEVIAVCSNTDVAFLSDVVSTNVFEYKKYFKLVTKSDTETYLEGPDCSFPLNRSMKDVLPVLEAKYKRYGKRVQQSAEDGEFDTKAFYHAFRILWEMEDYINNKKLEFPCSRVQQLIDIRSRKYDPQYVMDWIEAEIQRVEQIPNTLPEPDRAYWDKMLLDWRMMQAQTDVHAHLLK